MKTITKPPLKRKLLAVFVMSYFATACGSSSNSVSNNIDNETPQEIAMALIAAYAQDGTNTPSLQNYQDAGVEGVTTDNLADLNTLVESLTQEDVDTVAELDALTAQLGINIIPTVNAGEDLSATVNQELVITGTAQDSDGSISQYEWKNGDDVVLATTASFNYTPSTEGTDTLILTVTDNDGGVASDSVVITVSAAIAENQAPTANAGVNASVEVNQSITLEGSGTDTDGTITAYEWKDGDGNVIGTEATLSYTPTSTGTQVLTLMVTDNDQQTATDTVELLVNAAPPPVNQAPTASDITANTDEDISTTITLLGSDAEEATLSYITENSPAHGVVNLVGNIATYTPDLNYNGNDSFTYKVNDGTSDSAIATVNITVEPVNDAPFAFSSALPAVVSEGSSAQLSSQGSYDLEGDALSYNWVPADRLDDPTAAQPTYTAPLVNQESSVIFTLTVTDNGNPSLASSSTVDLTVLNDAPPAVQPNFTGRMNDTGQTTCSDYPFVAPDFNVLSNTGTQDVGCTNSVGTTDADGDLIPPGQDAQHTSATFSFTKLDADGVALADQTGTQFSCVKDNVTGLIWEVKTDSGLHSIDDSFTWFDGVNGTDKTAPPVPPSPEFAKSGGIRKKLNLFPVVATCYGTTPESTDSRTFCNTKAYTERVNKEGFCGASDWQLPTINESFSLVNYSLPDSIDTNYFPKRSFIKSFWTSSNAPGAFSSTLPLYLLYGVGASIGSSSSASLLRVRLVRRATPSLGQ